jgi:two-component system sensor histidine kinase QseC
MKSLKNYTLKYLVYVLPVVVALWAGLFYAFILDEVYDNVDDGLKNQKLNIIRQAYLDSTVLRTQEFGINQFRILPTDSIDKANVYSREFIYMEYDAEMEPYRLLRTGFYGPDGQPYTLEIRTSTVEEDDLVIDLSIALLVLYLLLVLTIFLVNNAVLTRALSPLKTFTENIQKYRFGTKSTVKPMKSTVSEFQILSDHVQEMITRNEKLFLQQKTFIENASHELQTPLAISINQLELLLQDESLNEMQSKRIDDTKSALHRLVHLNRSLLMLSRIENRQFPEFEKVSFTSVWKDLEEEMEDLLRFKELQLSTHFEEDFIVDAHPELMRILLSNLYRNAIRYSTKNGRIEVAISKDKFEIGNSADMPALNPEIVYDRFYKYPQDSQSTGLGLSIVQSIVQTYPHLQIQYRYEKKTHYFYILSQKFPNSQLNFTA